MTVLITGGAGFVGLNIAEQLLKAGTPVVSYGLQAPPVWAMDRLEALPGRISVKMGDVRDRETLVETIREYRVQRIVHGAAITAALDREAQQAPLIAAVNLGGTIEVLEAALECGVERVVQLGSGSVYGASVKRDGLLDEVDDVPVPDSLYGITKYAAERTALRYGTTRDLSVVVARLGVVFGRWEYDTGVRDTLSIPLTLTQMAQSGSHAVLRSVVPDDWVYGSDVAWAVLRLLQAPSLAQPLYHVSGGRRWSAVSWCARLRERYPSFTYEVAEDPAAANVGRLSPGPRPPFAIARLQEDLGYAARFGEAEAFSDFIAWRDGVVL
jgi:nucleoside-diphosphate-sugar epimerase